MPTQSTPVDGTKPARIRERLRHVFKRQPKGQPTAKSPTSPDLRALPSLQANGDVHATKTESKKLWEHAIGQLPPDDRSLVRKYTNATSDIQVVLEGILYDVQDKREICESKRWTFSLNGRHISVREEADRVIDWLNRFKQAGDVAVNADPIHAGLPWALVRILLQGATLEQEQLGAIIVGLERVVYTLNRCKIYQSLYLQPALKPETKAVRSNLEEALSALYGTILRFLVNALHIMDKNSFYRAAHAFWKPDDILSFRGDCDRAEQQLDRAVDTFEQELANLDRANVDQKFECLMEDLKTLQRLKDAQDLQQSTVQDIWIHQSKERRRQILQWTSTIPYLDHHETVVAQRLGSTCGWLLQHDRFKRWIESDESMILWLHGIPGAGKTRLISRVIDDCLQNQVDGTGIAYVYCSRYEENRRKAIDVLRTYVKQLCVSSSNEVHRLLVNAYTKKEDFGFASAHFTLKESEDLLHELVASMTKTVIILDALDECHKQDRLDLMGFFNNIVKVDKPVKILISSRRNVDIERQLQRGIEICIKAEDNHADIHKFVQEKIQEDRKRREEQGIRLISEPLQREIVKTVLEKSQGMFQWTSLQVTQLLSLEREKDIRARLNSLPMDLTKTYDEIISRIEAQDGSKPETASRTIQWIWASSLPLRRTQLLAAVCQDPNDDTIFPVDIEFDYILDSCQSLCVVIDNIIRFSHLSVEDYLRRSPSWTFQESQELLISVCLNVLCADSGEPSIKDLRRYAMKYWYDHVNELEAANISPRTQLLLLRFFHSPIHPSAACARWMEERANLWWFDPLHGTAVTSEHGQILPIFPVCLLGFSTVLRAWISSNEVDVNQRNKNGYPLLCFAIAGHSYDIFELLLEEGADCNTEGKPLWAAMVYALKHGYYAYLRRLLAHGADENLTTQGFTTSGNPSRAKFSGYGSALSAASSHMNLEVMKLLLSHGANPNSKLEGLHGNALIAALSSSLWYEDDVGGIVRVERKGYGWIFSEPDTTIPRQLIPTLELLLAYEADITLRTKQHGSALEVAVRIGDHMAVQTLLEKARKQFDIRELPNCTKSYLRAFELAVLYEKLDICKALLECGADIKAPWAWIWFESALISLARHNAEDLVRLLLEKELEAASYLRSSWNDAHGSLEIIQHLFGHEVRIGVDERRAYGFILMCSHGYTNVARAFLGSGVDVNVSFKLKEEQTVTALSAASKVGNTDTVEMLLAAEAVVREDSLAAAIYGGHTDILRLLLEHGASFNIKDGVYGNAIAAAAAAYDVEIIKALLKHGSQIGLSPDDILSPALESALRRIRPSDLLDFDKTICLLLGHGVGLDTEFDQRMQQIMEQAGYIIYDSIWERVLV